MRYNFAARWYRPDGSEPQSWELGGLSISDRILSLGNLNSSVGDASQLFAFASPDLQVTMNNQDGFWTNEIKNQVLPVRVTNANSRYQFEISRDGTQMFRGYVLLTSFDLDRKNRTVTFTALGPMRLCEEKSADSLRRNFPVTQMSPSSTPGVGFAKDTNTFNISVAGFDVLPGDTLALSATPDDDSGDEYVITGVESVTVTTDKPATKDYPVTTYVTCRTPYHRNVYIGSNTQTGIVNDLFDHAGIGQYDVRWSGLVSSSPFFQTFNTQGTSGYGEIRGLNQVYDNTGLNLRRLYVNFREDSFLGNGIRYSTGVNAQFVDGGTQVGDGTVLDGTRYLHGGFYERGDHGVPATVGLSRVKMYADSFDVSVGAQQTEGSTVFNSWDGIVKRYAVSPSGTRMYELRFTCNAYESEPGATGQNNRPILSPAEWGTLRKWKTELRRYTTVNAGTTWSMDTSWYAPLAAPSAVVTSPGSATLSYRYSAYDSNGQFLGVSSAVTVSNAPSSWGNVFLNWADVAGASFYRVHRIGTSQAAAYRSGIVATTYVSEAYDYGFTPNSISDAPGEYAFMLDFGTTYTGSDILKIAGPLYGWSLSVAPFNYSSGSAPFVTTTDIVYASAWNGNYAQPNTYRLHRILINNAASPKVINNLESVSGSTLDGIRNYNTGEHKATETDANGNYSPLRTELYFITLGEPFSFAPGLCHGYEMENGTSGNDQIISCGSWTPQLRTLRWNQLDGSESRIGFFACSRESGTAVVSMTPGHRPVSGGTIYGFSIVGISVLDALDPGYTRALLPSGSQIWTATGSLYRSGSDIGAIEFNNTNSSMFISPWRTSVGGQLATLWVGYGAGRWFIYSERHSGFLSYANFEGLSVAAALQELAFIVNATVSVEWLNGLPYGKFISRDLSLTENETPKVLMNTDGTNPPGANQALLIDVDDVRVWNQTYSQVTVSGSTDDAVATAGSLDYKQDGLEVNARFIETKTYAQVIADSLLTYYGPAESGVLQTPRQAATVTVWDDGTIYTPRKVVRFPDAWNTPSPLAGEDRLPLAWWVESVDVNPTEPTVRLSVVQRDIP